MDLISNVKAIVSAVKEAKPESIKGKYIKSVYLSTTMGPSVAVDIEKNNSGEIVALRANSSKINFG